MNEYVHRQDVIAAMVEDIKTHPERWEPRILWRRVNFFMGKYPAFSKKRIIEYTHVARRIIYEELDSS